MAFVRTVPGTRLGLVFLVVLNDFSDDEVQEFLGEFRVEVGPVARSSSRAICFAFARGIGRRKVVFGLEFPHGLGVFEPLAQRVDEDRVEPVDAFAVALEQLGGAPSAQTVAVSVCVSVNGHPFGLNSGSQ
jgi:hypothetical protein